MNDEIRRKRGRFRNMTLLNDALNKCIQQAQLVFFFQKAMADGTRGLGGSEGSRPGGAGEPRLYEVRPATASRLFVAAWPKPARV